jgi:hypothetical protein
MGLTTEKASDGGRIHVRFDELNRAYAELVRKYKDITRERKVLKHPPKRHLNKRVIGSFS